MHRRGMALTDGFEADATATNGDADGFGQAFAEEIEEISAEVDAATEAKAD